MIGVGPVKLIVHSATWGFSISSCKAMADSVCLCSVGIETFGLSSRVRASSQALHEHVGWMVVLCLRLATRAESQLTA